MHGAEQGDFQGVPGGGCLGRVVLALLEQLEDPRELRGVVLPRLGGQRALLVIG